MANDNSSYPPPYDQSQSMHTSYQHSYTAEFSPNSSGFHQSYPNNAGFQQSYPNDPGFHQSRTEFHQSHAGYPQNHPAAPPGFQPSHTEFLQNQHGHPPMNHGFQQGHGELHQNHPSFHQSYIGSTASQLPDKAGNPANHASGNAPAQVPLTSVTQHGSSVHYVGPQHNFVPVGMSQAIPLGPSSSTVVCPKCKETVTTQTRREASRLAWLGCCILAVIGCFCGCCLIPFCIGQCQIVHHTCPKCKTYLGKYSRLN